MIVETITVTATPTPLEDLIQAARGAPLPFPQSPSKTIVFRSLDDAEVHISEPLTLQPVPLLVPDDDQRFASLDTIREQVILSCPSGSASVGVIATT